MRVDETEPIFFIVGLAFETVPCGDLHWISPFPFPKNQESQTEGVWPRPRRVNHRFRRLQPSYSYCGFQRHGQPRGGPRPRPHRHRHRRPHPDRPLRPQTTRPIRDASSNANVNGWATGGVSRVGAQL